MERVEYQPLVIQDLVNLHHAGELDLAPWYQRRSVWKTPQKAYLINTLFEQKPIPSCYVRHYLDVEKEKSIKEVVDGQQRMRAILEYVSGDFRARHPNHKRPVAYSDLTANEKSKLRMTSLSIGYLIGAGDDDVIEIFGRLNSVSKTLNAQEKRNARFSGEFKQFALREAAKRVQLWRDLGVFTATDISRMTEVQFVADLTINLSEGLSDFSDKLLDEFYDRYDEEFKAGEAISTRMEKVFSKIASADPKYIRDTIFARSPLFFTLFNVLDGATSKITRTQLEEGLHRVDEAYNSDTPVSDRSRSEAEFYIACTSSTQRIKSRRIRDAYIRRVFRIRPAKHATAAA
jgi:hypothetical protein